MVVATGVPQRAPYLRHIGADQAVWVATVPGHDSVAGPLARAPGDDVAGKRGPERSGLDMRKRVWASRS